MDTGTQVAGVVLGIYAALSAGFWSLAFLYSKYKQSELQKLRTSTSTALDGQTRGEKNLISKSEDLLKSSWMEFEAPTVIRYEKGQVRQHLGLSDTLKDISLSVWFGSDTSPTL